jgi:hypothetical protein
MTVLGASADAWLTGSVLVKAQSFSKFQVPLARSMILAATIPTASMSAGQPTSQLPAARQNRVGGHRHSTINLNMVNMTNKANYGSVACCSITAHRPQQPLQATTSETSFAANRLA